MEVRIGVVHTPKELTLDVDGSLDDTLREVEKAMKDGDVMLWLTDSKGRKVGVPVDKVAYIEVDAEAGSKRVGFGNI